MPDSVLYPRRAEELTLEALADTRVVVVNGARQVGKSTLAKMIVQRTPGAHELYLDDPTVRAAADADPATFVRHDGLLLIDEIQRVPELLLAIKREVDRDPAPGRFLLTGSARLLDLRDLPDALPGRTETIELWPLSQGEIDGSADGFIDAIFSAEGNVTMPPCRLTKRDYVSRALRGGYPEAIRRDDGRRRARFFDSYITDLITRDVRQISDIERPAEMRRLLSVVAARMGMLAVVQSIADAVRLPRMTLSRYLDLLELVFVIRRIPAWSSNLTTRAISTPKLIVTDSGLGGRLIGLSEMRAKDPSAPVGPLLENFAIGEVARQLVWAEEPVQLFHYRDRDHYEVDMPGACLRASGRHRGQGGRDRSRRRLQRASPPRGTSWRSFPRRVRVVHGRTGARLRRPPRRATHGRALDFGRRRAVGRGIRLRPIRNNDR